MFWPWQSRGGLPAEVYPKLPGPAVRKKRTPAGRGGAAKLWGFTQEGAAGHWQPPFRKPLATHVSQTMSLGNRWQGLSDT